MISLTLANIKKKENVNTPSICTGAPKGLSAQEQTSGDTEGVLRASTSGDGVPLILCQLYCGLHPPGCTPTRHRLAVSCPLAMSSALPIRGPGLSRCSTDASRILANYPVGCVSGIFTCQAHTDLLVKALPPLQPPRAGLWACGVPASQLH